MQQLLQLLHRARQQDQRKVSGSHGAGGAAGRKRGRDDGRGLLGSVLMVTSGPLVHRSVLYNCTFFILGNTLLFIRPKTALASDGNYREGRWFAAWRGDGRASTHQLPPEWYKFTPNGDGKVPIGDCVLRVGTTIIGTESCEELFTPNPLHVRDAEAGAHIFVNCSASHTELRKLSRRIALIQGATRTVGGVYVYANVHGCDGDRVYYDGCPLIFCNGYLCAQGDAFTLDDTEVVHATVDLTAVDAFRMSYNARSIQAADAHGKARVDTVDYSHLQLAFLPEVAPPLVRPSLRLYSDLEEIALGPSAWLWDYLRRSGMGGFMLPLSGGADSAAVAALVGIMCQRLAERLRLATDGRIADQLANMLPPDHPAVTNPTALSVSEVGRSLAANFLTTCYMGCSIGSTDETRDRAARISTQIGGTHMVANIDAMVESANAACSAACGAPPATFAEDGARTTDSVALENVQARSRMVLAYLFAQRHASIARRHGPTSRGLLVLASSNVDEALRGYLTKYDCSAADLNPIGAIAKGDLKRFLMYASKQYEWPALAEAAAATPSAELRPGAAQVDEEEMGVTYEELGKFGELRSLHRAGMVSAFIRLVREWGPGTAANRTPRDLADLVRRLFHHFAVNRHKATVATPSYHAEYYSPDDNRFDQRQFLYPPSDVQWKQVERLVSKMEADDDEATAAGAAHD